MYIHNSYAKISNSETIIYYLMVVYVRQNKSLKWCRKSLSLSPPHFPVRIFTEINTESNREDKPTSPRRNGNIVKLYNFIFHRPNKTHLKQSLQDFDLTILCEIPDSTLIHSVYSLHQTSFWENIDYSLLMLKAGREIKILAWPHDCPAIPHPDPIYKIYKKIMSVFLQCGYLCYRKIDSKSYVKMDEIPAPRTSCFLLD